MVMIPEQCRAARSLLSWTMQDLAGAAEGSPDTVRRFEDGETLKPETVARLQRALERGGVVFKSNGDGPGVHLKRRRK